MGQPIIDYLCLISIQICFVMRHEHDSLLSYRSDRNTETRTQVVVDAKRIILTMLEDQHVRHVLNATNFSL